MMKLNRHELDFDLTYKYIQQNLNETNALSSELLKLIDFKNGVFFTLLPNEANFERCYKFEEGAILPQYPEQKYYVSGKECSYSMKPSIRKEISKLIYKEMNKTSKLICILDSVNSSYEEMFLRDPFYYFRKNHNDEIYLLINNNSAYIELILECLRYSNACWHSLCILTTCSFEDSAGRELSSEKIKEICLTTKIIIVGAYDGEGYIFWEKRQK